MRKSTFSLPGVLFLAVATLTVLSCDDNNKIEYGEDSLSVQPTTFEFESQEQQSQEFKVSKSAESYRAVLLNQTDTWVKITPQGDSFFVSVDDFTDESATESRETTIAVTSGVAAPVWITISQKNPGGGGPDKPEKPDPVDMKLESDRLEFDAVGELFKSVKLNTEIEKWDIDVEYDASWIKKAEVRGGYLRVTVEENIGEERDARITLKSELAKEDAVLTVYQDVIQEFDFTGRWHLTAEYVWYNRGSNYNLSKIDEEIEIIHDQKTDTYLMYIELEAATYGNIWTNFVFEYDPITEELTFEQGAEQVGENNRGEKHFNYILLENQSRIGLDLGTKLSLLMNETHKIVQTPPVYVYEGSNRKPFIGLAITDSPIILEWYGIDEGFFLGNFKLQR